jgi:transcriptional regulator with XRE-family HTH domain
MKIQGDLSLAEVVRLTRKRKKWTQEELAKQAGVSRNYIGMIERGHDDVTLYTLNRVVNALGFNISFSVKWQEDENEG